MEACTENVWSWKPWWGLWAMPIRDATGRWWCLLLLLQKSSLIPLIGRSICSNPSGFEGLFFQIFEKKEEGGVVSAKLVSKPKQGCSWLKLQLFQSKTTAVLVSWSLCRVRSRGRNIKTRIPLSFHRCVKTELEATTFSTKQLGLIRHNLGRFLRSRTAT